MYYYTDVIVPIDYKVFFRKNFNFQLNFYIYLNIVRMANIIESACKLRSVCLCLDILSFLAFTAVMKASNYSYDCSYNKINRKKNFAVLAVIHCIIFYI